MAVAKNGRPDKRFPTFYSWVSGTILAGFILVIVWVYVSPSQLVVSSYPSLAETEIRRLGKGNHTQEEEVGNIVNTGTTSDEIHQRKEGVHNIEEAATSTKQLQKSEIVTENDKQISGKTDTSTQHDLESEIRSNDILAPRSRHKREKSQTLQSYAWEICNWDTAADYIPCLDNQKAIKLLQSTSHYEHRERHCPFKEDVEMCLAPLPRGYKKPIRWPESRDRIWYGNVPHQELVSYKKDQNWVKQSGEHLLFPGGGTQFPQGALHYINYLENVLPDIAWGTHTRVVLDVGCGVASLGGHLFEKDVLTMSFAPKDEHEAQVQMALERGIPAISAVMGTQRLPFPSNVYDMVHCARCRVPWDKDDGRLLLEVNRILRPGGYFVWSATPVYRTQAEEVKIWRDTSSLAASICWNQLARTTDSETGIGIAIFQKPQNNFCYVHRKQKIPPLCEEEDNRDVAWYVPLKSCIHPIPTETMERGVEWPQDWPQRLEVVPNWLQNIPKGLFGKPAAEEFNHNTGHWKYVVEKSYLRGLGIDWQNVRNIMDMKANYGSFAAALSSLPIWVMNVVPVHEPDTLPVIYDRGLFGIYHDWCESFSTYPRTYDLLHADHLFFLLKKRCDITNTVLEMDRILRPDGWVVLREKVETMVQLQVIIKSLHWDERLSYIQGQEQLLVFQKGWWRPEASSQ